MSITAINKYHQIYEESRIWEKNSWMGIPCWKLPMDAFVIQELIVKIKPNVIIETGTGHGGSAMFYASICELLGEGIVISIDIDQTKKNSNEWDKFIWENRIKFLSGSSVSEFTIDKIDGIIDLYTDNPKCMVILDSWHTKEYVYKEMNIYSKFVSVGGYMIVEDTHAGKPGNPIEWKYDDPGPSASVKKFLEENKDEWEVDYECEKHLMSFNPSGYLKRVK